MINEKELQKKINALIKERDKGNVDFNKQLNVFEKQISKLDERRNKVLDKLGAHLTKYNAKIDKLAAKLPVEETSPQIIAKTMAMVDKPTRKK